MDVKLIDTYLDNIAELVVDEGRIVTCKTLSRKFGIHINIAKQLLYKFLQDQKAKGQTISATYLLAGKLSDETYSVTIVNEEDLNTASSKFSEITSEHVYSIHKGENVKEIKLLCDLEIEKVNLKSSCVIKCSKSVLKNHKVSNQNNVVQNKELSIKSQDETKPIADKLKKETVLQHYNTRNSPKKSGNETLQKSPKKTSPSDKKPKTNTEKEQGNKKPKGNIANFFANAAQKNAEKTSEAFKNKSNVLNNKNVKIPEIDVNEKNKSEEKTKQAAPKTKRNNTKENKNKQERNKRKRIQVLSDSEDDTSSSGESEKEEQQFVEESPPTPPPHEEEKVDKQLPNEEPTQNKRKKRKIVDKTILNENGYLETRKEIVLKTDSEDEDDEKLASKSENTALKKTKLDEGNEKGKTSLSGTRKQSSLLNFFRKNS